MDIAGFSFLLIFLIGVALLFDFLNGLHDAANSIATVVSTGVLRPHHAVAADSRREGNTEFGQLLLHESAGRNLLPPEFGMGVQLLVERVEFWIVACDRGLDRLLEQDGVDLGVVAK